MEKKHSLHILFPLGLLAVFAAGVVTVLLFTASVYQGSVERSEVCFNSTTALAYVCEKIRQNDAAQTVCLGNVEGADALVLTREHGGAHYDTYIYCWDGSLRELMVKRELPPEGSAGRVLLPAMDFTAEMMDQGLLRLTCTDETGQIREAFVALRGGEEGLWN